MSIKKGRFYLTFKSSLIAFFLIKFFVNYSQPFCNLTATLQKEKICYYKSRNTVVHQTIVFILLCFFIQERKEKSYA